VFDDDHHCQSLFSFCFGAGTFRSAELGACDLTLAYHSFFSSLLKILFGSGSPRASRVFRLLSLRTLLTPRRLLVWLLPLKICRPQHTAPHGLTSVKGVLPPLFPPKRKPFRAHWSGISSVRYPDPTSGLVLPSLLENSLYSPCGEKCLNAVWWRIACFFPCPQSPFFAF